MANFIIAVILLIGVGGAITYIIKEKKKGTICIGCPNVGSCASKNCEDSDCGCH